MELAFRNKILTGLKVTAGIVFATCAVPVAVRGFDSRAKGILYWVFGGTFNSFASC